MGNSLMEWRARIGSFTQPWKLKTHMDTLKPKHVMLCIRTALFLMLVAQCVEPHPGPNSKTTKTHGPASGSSRATIHDTGNDLRELRSTGRQRLSSSSADLQPNSLSTWLRRDNSENTQFNLQSSQDTLFPSDDVNPTLILMEISRDVKKLNSRFDTLEESVNDIKQENRKLTEQNHKLTTEVSVLKDQMKNLEAQVSKHAIHQERVEWQNKRSNLKIYNINQSPNESAEETETKVKSFLTRDLGIPESEINMERVYRLPSHNSPNPVFIELSSAKTRDKILKIFKDKRKSGANLSICVSEDLPQRIAQARSGLYHLMKESIDNHKQAYFKYDYLIVEGKKYVFDPLLKIPVLVPEPRKERTAFIEPGSLPANAEISNT